MIQGFNCGDTSKCADVFVNISVFCVDTSRALFLLFGVCSCVAAIVVFLFFVLVWNLSFLFGPQIPNISLAFATNLI